MNFTIFLNIKNNYFMIYEYKKHKKNILKEIFLYEIFQKIEKYLVSIILEYVR